MENYIFLGGCGLFAIIFPLAFTYGIFLTIKRNKSYKELQDFMTSAGFAPVNAPDDMPPSKYGIPGKISKAMRLNKNGQDFFWVEKKVRTANPGGSSPSRIETRREFHFPLKRSSDRKIIVAFAQKETPAFVKTIVTKLLDFATGDSMTHIELPHDLRDSGILAALAETRHDSLYDLIDRETLDQALSAPSNCIVMLFAEKDHAAIGYDFDGRTVDSSEFWALIKKIMRLPADI